MKEEIKVEVLSEQMMKFSGQMKVVSERMDEMFVQMNKMFEQMNKGFEQMEQRFDALSLQVSENKDAILVLKKEIHSINDTIEHIMLETDRRVSVNEKGFIKIEKVCRKVGHELIAM